MLYKLVIVEDEEIIRNGLKCYINWQVLGFEVAGTFADGKDAFEYIKENPCDVVLTDVMMSTMTGLELARRLQEIFPHIQVVILSGYSEFSYAREAIRYKVEDYLLKPVDEEEISQVFMSLRKKLESAQMEKRLETLFKEAICGSCGGTNQVSGDKESNSLIADFWSKILVAALNLEDMVQVETVIADMMREVEEFSIEDISIVLKKIYYLIALDFQRRKIDVIQITNGMFHYNRLPQDKNCDEITKCLIESFTHLYNALTNLQIDYGTGVVGFAAEYIENHFSEDLGNDVIARKLRIHPSYLSRVFRRETGESLMEYILRIRMKKAVKLMKSEKYKLADISQMLGYTSASYFSAQFKKYTGYSPSEYNFRMLEK